MICEKHNELDAEGNKVGERIWFFCPGCKDTHALRVNSSLQPCWTWNDDLEKPTFKPSLNCTIKYGDPDRPNRVCHSFITDGKMQFLGDCTHELKGQTVPMPEIPEQFVD
jgi:hypothetical protein